MTDLEKEEFLKKYCIDKTSDFLPYVDQIKKKISELPFEKTCMKGLYNDLLKMKKRVEKYWDDEGFWLDYSVTEARWYGWNGECQENNEKISGDIKDKFLDLYATILKGIYGGE